MLSEVGSSSLQWFEGKMNPFSVVFYIVGPDMIETMFLECLRGGESLSLLLTATYIKEPDMIESVCFWSVSGVVKVCYFY